MSLFRDPAEHAANPPETWEVIKKMTGSWALAPKGVTDYEFERFPTKRKAEEAKTKGFCFNLWHKEARWYAGEQVAGWRPYAEVAADPVTKVINEALS